MNGGLIDYQAAVVGFAVAFLLAVLLTPVVSQAAWRVGVVDASTEARRLHERPTPLLGGLAILCAIAIPALALGHDHGFWGIIAGAALMSALGALDDIRPLHPGAKLIGLILIASIPAALGITIDHITLPVIGRLQPGCLAVRGHRSSGSSRSPTSSTSSTAWTGWRPGFAPSPRSRSPILSASLGRVDAAAISAIVAGAAFGFLIYNFNPATIFMGDSGSLMLGYLLAALSIQGVLKTAAAVSLVFPLMILALPILDTSFVILKRLKYRQPIYQADRWHFHHRLANVGLSQRRTALYLYAGAPRCRRWRWRSTSSPATAMAGIRSRSWCWGASARSPSGHRCTSSTCSRSSRCATFRRWD